MNGENTIISYCSVCSTLKYDSIINKHAQKLLKEIFPQQELQENAIICTDCSSTLDQIQNIENILRESETILKNELNNLNFANFIMWSNNEPNKDDLKCQVCLRIHSYEDISCDDDNTVSNLFPDMDTTFIANVKICKMCKIILQNLNNFKKRYYHKAVMPTPKTEIKSESLEKAGYESFFQSLLDSSFTSDEEFANSTKKLNDTSFTSDEEITQGTKKSNVVQKGKCSYTMYMVESTEKEIKRVRRKGIYLYSCPSCKKIVDDIQTHIKVHDAALSKIVYGCDRCNFKNESAQIMNAHLCKETTDIDKTGKRFKCDLCPFKSRQKGNVKTHMLTHKNPEEIPMYKCTKCKFQARQKGNLKTHMLIHKSNDEIIWYSCNYCKFKAKQKGNLHTHMLRLHKDK